ncbi:MAG: LytR family transcriptional regulator, partial [Streptomyces sp.]|nr:LytR family transcriptional regulator [Streptomyces sp.]
MAGLLVLGAGAAGWAYWHLDHNIKSVDINQALGDDRPARPVITPSPSASPLPTGSLNILVLGSDSRSGKENKALGGGDSSGARSDTAMVFHIDAGRKKATVVSIPRDTLVTRPSCPLKSGGSTAVAYHTMFNSAYSVGGAVCAVKTAESITNVRMDHYVEIDFSGFAKLVNALGGVTVTTDQDIDDDDSHLHLKAGTHTLNGKQALALARTRHGIGDGSDLGRIGLQQKLVKALLEQISSTNLFTDPAKLYT